MADPLSLVPSGSQYNELRWTLAILKRDFPQDYAGLTNQDARIQGWVTEIDSGSGRDADQIRDDIVKYVMDRETTKQVYGISDEEFDQLVLGANEGGINFADLAARGGSVGSGSQTKDAGGVDVSKGAEAEESINKTGVGIDDNNPDTPDLKILTGEKMKWYFDKSSGKWYVEYGLPNSDRNMIFEAEPDQMDALFGAGFRPDSFQYQSLKNLAGRQNSTFSGNISEMEGTGTFEGEVARVTALALDNGRLPDWASENGEAMDIIFTAQSEGKSTDWTLDQLSKTAGFKQRFPSIDKFMKENNLSLGEGISGFLEYEAGLKQALQSVGQSADAASPELVGKLLDAGHSITVVNDTVNGFRRMKEYAPAMQAFNSVLASQGLDQITDIQGMLDFVQGRSSADVYDLYEASSLAESAAGAGLGDIFSAEDALSAAKAGSHSLESATQGMQKAAEMLLRLRHEVDVNKFGLDHEELIDISLGQAPRSGRSQAEVLENVNRAVSSAQAGLQKRAQAFKQYGSGGQPQAASLRGLRQES